MADEQKNFGGDVQDVNVQQQNDGSAADAPHTGQGTGDGAATGDTGTQVDTLLGQAGQEPPDDAGGQEEKAEESQVQDENAVPVSPEAYQIPIPEGMQADPAMVDGFRKLAHARGLTQSQVTGLVEWLNSQATEQSTSQAAAWEEQRARQSETARAVLQDTWKGDFQKNLKTAGQAYRALATPEFRDLMEATGMGNHPAVIRMFHGLHGLIGEHAYVDGTHVQPKKRERTIAGTPILDYPSMDT